jgi:intracellular septation protein
MSAPAKSPQFSWPWLAINYGPLALFGIAYAVFGYFVATGVLMVTAVAAVAFEYWRERRIAPMPLVTAVLVVVLGGLTLYTGNKTYLKIKPTIAYLFFGIGLLGGAVFNRYFIKYAMEQFLQLSETGWRILTYRWGFFFLGLALLNEIVWRNFSTSVWVAFKIFGAVPLFFLFALAQTPLIMKHEIEADPPDGTKSS